ncbi:helix-turn-helix domain-containing protein [Paenibacillus elgii]
MSLSIKIKLGEAIEAADKATGGKVSKYAIAREAKVRPNLIYDLCDGKTKRIDLDTLSTIIKTLNELSGRKHTISDILEYEG